MTKTITHYINPACRVEQIILAGISWSLNVPPYRLQACTNLKEDLNLDEVDKLLLIAELEHRLNTFISLEQADGIETVGDLQSAFASC